ncbi:MocR-like pyridoxine biosynthesis transcription factor PdxR [Noviherbaspirillum aerium]|uniref:MocR-like pyridoxine biosynthesis transcription factor PdxR n=1 Tax=Noviherbaspirillum aerium TaxID=2588497 RepID=UPI00124F60AC|nr:PLP-dependent aminotransferase family protein [Noviherbaspirillum aerium]
MHFAQSLAALQLDAQSATPLFRQLYDGIKQSILAGKLGSGTQLPPTRELALLCGVSRQTVLNAYSQLMAEGYLSGTVGRGTFVSASLPLQAQKHVAASSLQAMRPLSARGQRFTGMQAQLPFHQGPPRAFRIGMPGLDVFPFDVWGRLEARRWRKPPHELGYGDPAGYRPLREALAGYLRAARGVQCSAEQIIITSGSQQAVYLIASMLLAAGDQAWVEEPGYRGINASLHAAEATVCPVAVDAEGMVVSHGMSAYPQARLVYVTPTHQLPLGMTMSLPRRLELLAWAAASKSWVIEDDYDSEYRYTGPPLASLQSLDKTGCVIYVGTLSKVLFPGLRLGYIVAPPALAEAFAQGKAIIDRHAPLVPQAVLADFIMEGHFGRHIKRTREVYAERRSALMQAIDARLADRLSIGITDTGLHLPVMFRQQCNDEAVARNALEHGLEIRALSHFYNAAPADIPQPRACGMLLGFAAIPPEDIRRGAAALETLLDEFHADSKGKYKGNQAKACMDAFRGGAAIG